MSFFKQFPRTAYIIDDTAINIPDIFRRVAANSLIDNMTIMNLYDIQDAERPEHISYDVYGTTDYYWVILIANNIIDPYHDWPKSTTDLRQFAEQKYGAANLGKIHHYVSTANEKIRVDYDETKFNAGTIGSISNMRHEEIVNEEKRRIKIPKPEYVAEIAGQFRKLIRG